MSALGLVVAIIASTCIIGFFVGLALTCVKDCPSSKKIGAVLSSVCLMICALTFGFTCIVAGFSEASVTESKTLEVLNLPNSMVEIVMTNGVLTEARIVETVGDAVGVRSYTNVEWNKTEGLSKLEIKQQTITRKCGCIELYSYERKLAVFS